jgi:hypothetical protein
VGGVVVAAPSTQQHNKPCHRIPHVALKE